MPDVLKDALADLDKHLGIEPQPDASPEGTSEQQQEASDEGTSEQRARDEQGRFTSHQDAGDETEEQPQEELILGRFKSHDDLANAYKELESEFGRRNQDWQELKQLREEISGLPQQWQQTQQQQQVAASAPQAVQQLLNEGRYREAADYAASVPDQGYLYGQVLQNWGRDDPDQANTYQQMQWIAHQQQQLLNVANQTALETAYNRFSAGKPDLEAVAPAMLEVAQESPKVLQLLQDPDPQTRIEVLDYLYTKAKGRVSTELTGAASEAAKRQAEEANAAKQQAFVGTGTRRVEPETPTEGDQWLDSIGFDEAIKRYT